jgi:hypothetical protein
MEVLRLKEIDIISFDDSTEVFRTVESYLLRRIICDLPSNSLNKVFLTLAHDIFRLDGSWDGFVEKMKFVLSSKKEKARFPDDSEFAEGLLHKNVYKLPPRYKAYLFERFENGDNLEHKSIYNLLDSGVYTIEHIMPQTLSAKWQEELGADYEVIHDTWLHRLANLTLSAYNSSYSNHSFDDKRTMEDGFLYSGIRMNQRIAGESKWGIIELERRAEYMKKQAFELWPFCKTTYAPIEKQFDEYALDDDIIFTNKSIAKYRYSGIEQGAQSWAEMYVAVLRMLHEKNKTIFNYLADADDAVELAIHFARNESDFNRCAKIDDNIYVWMNTSTQYKINLLLKHFEVFGEDPENLVFLLK